MLTLTQNDYSGRITDMQQKLNESALDAVIIVSNEAEPANVRYFTNYWPVFETAGLLIPKVGKPLLLVGPETEKLVEKHSTIKDYRKLLEFRESSDPEYPDISHSKFSDVFAEVNGGEKIRRLGLIGTNIMTVQVYEGILGGLEEGIEIIKADNLLRSMRMIKSPKEIAMLREAASIAVKGFEYALGRIKPGMTEIQAAAECMYGVLSQGAEAPGFMIWCVSGQNTNQAIGRSTHKIIEKGEIIQFTMGSMYEGYVSSFGRPFAFGNVDQQVLNMLEVGLEANKLTHQLMKPGASASDIANRVHGHIRENGMGDYIVYGPAHGTGMMECEFPFVESVSDYRLQTNMSFAVDTFLAAPNFGMRFEDTVVITDNGAEQLAPYRREIILL